MMAIYEKLMHIQSKLKAPKNQRNTFGNYNYRSCEDILEALKPLMEEQKTALIINDEPVQIGERYYIKATAKLLDSENGECVEVSALAREEEDKKGMDASQITGSTSSYARKYALNGLFCIDDSHDSDATNTHESAQEVRSKKKNDKSINITEAEKKAIQALCKRKGIEEKTVLNYYRVDDFLNMTKDVYMKAVTYLNKKQDKAVG